MGNLANGMEQERGALVKENAPKIFVGDTPVEVVRVISTMGGQGDIYEANYNGKSYMLKWYIEDYIGGELYNAIVMICGEQKRPGPQFIWPLYLVTEENPGNGKNFGYLMDSLPDGYYDMEDFLRKTGDQKAVRFDNSNAMYLAGANIAKRVQEVHLRGYLYKNLSTSNFLINPKNGDVWGVDNDDLSLNGNPCLLLGTPGFMAPEIPRSGYKKLPNTETDYYSLAVVLYCLFCIDHPMEGKLWAQYPLITSQVEEYCYAIAPVFHFDPNNDTNRPTDVYASNAKTRFSQLTKEVQELFIQSFTVGVDNPLQRPTELSWIKACLKAREKIVTNLQTREETVIDFTNRNSILPGCLGIDIVNTKAGLSISKIPVYPQKAIYEVSVTGDYSKTESMTSVFAGFLWNQSKQSMMIHNMSDKIWMCYNPVTKKKDELGKNQDYPVKEGVMIEFNHDPQIIGTIFNPMK